MWMFTVRLADGGRLEAYKHIVSRPYLYADSEGREYAYTADGRYAEVWKTGVT